MSNANAAELAYMVDPCLIIYASIARHLHISVEGWRFIPHSYAMVNQYQVSELLRLIRILCMSIHDLLCTLQLLELIKRPNLLVSAIDQPYLKSWWKPIVGLFSPIEEVNNTMLLVLCKPVVPACF